MSKRITIDVKKLKASEAQQAAIEADIAKLLAKHIKKFNRSNKTPLSDRFSLSVAHISNIKRCYNSVTITPSFRGASNGTLQVSFENQHGVSHNDDDSIVLNNICSGNIITLYGNNSGGTIYVTISVDSDPVSNIIDDDHPNGSFLIL